MNKPIDRFAKLRENFLDGDQIFEHFNALDFDCPIDVGQEALDVWNEFFNCSDQEAERDSLLDDFFSAISWAAYYAALKIVSEMQGITSDVLDKNNLFNQIDSYRGRNK